MKKWLSSIIVVAFCLASFMGCAAKTERKVESVEYISPYIVGGNDAYALDVTTDTTSSENHKNRKLFLESLNDPIIATFKQSGADRDIVMRVYYDYSPVAFRVGETGEYSEQYVFHLESGMGLEIPFYLSPEQISEDSNTHKLMVDFIAGYGEFAMAKERQSEFYGATDLFDLAYTEDGEQTTILGSKYPLTQAEDYYDYINVNLLLTKDVSGVPQGDVYSPEKCYSATAGNEFKLNYLISNYDTEVESALLIITVGHEPVFINSQEYLWIDMKDRLLACGEVEFDCPDSCGYYDVIGYVVFDPFDFVSMSLRDMPQTSIRFTLDVDA